MLEDRVEENMSTKKFLFGILFLILFGLLLYLPFLGVIEFRGEEGRRVVYALYMLETKKFLIPTLFGEAYFTKPPLFNWVLAGAFYVFQNYSEFTARFVSSLSVISTSLLLALFWKNIVKPTSLYILLLPSLIYLTTPDVIDKALRAEIDAFYSFLVSLYVYLWFYLYEIKQRKSLAYLLAGIVAGFSILTKTFQGLIFFYLALIPYLFTEKTLYDLFKINRHFLFLLGAFFVFFSWILALHINGIEAKEILLSWIAEYKSAASAKEMTPSQHFFAFTIGAVFSLSPWLFFLIFYFKSLPKDDIYLYKLFKFSFFLFFFSYIFHLLFLGARFRYIMPSLSGFAFLCAMPLLYKEKILSLPAKKIFILLVIFVFLGKQIYSFVYYPYHVKNMNYFRNSALKVAELLQGKRTLYLCKAIPHHLIYYMKYRYHFVDEFIYIKELKDCQNLPHGAFALAEKNSAEGIKLSVNWEIIPLKIRKKDYLLIKVQ